jgi:hypothetical protein
MKRGNDFSQQPPSKRPATAPRIPATMPAGGKLTTQDALSYLREVSQQCALCAVGRFGAPTLDQPWVALHLYCY